MKEIQNRKARFDYEIESTLEAGIMLEGWEVKSFMAGHARIQEAYVKFISNELFLVNSNFSAPQYITYPVDSTRFKKLLVHKRESQKLFGALSREGYTLVPLRMYKGKTGKIKIEIGLAKGKTKYDKRQAEKEKTAIRELRQRDY